MLNKPFFLTLFLLLLTTLIGFVLDMVLILFKLEQNQWYILLASSIAAFYIGRIYVNNYQIKLPKIHKIKIVSYLFFMMNFFIFSLLWFMFTYIKLNIQDYKTFILESIICNFLLIFLVYFILGVGCEIESTKSKNVISKNDV